MKAGAVSNILPENFQHKQVEVHPESGKEGEKAECAEKVHRLLAVFLEKHHEEEVAENLECAPDSIFRPAELPRVMTDINLLHSCAVELYKNRYEAVEFAVEAEVFSHIFFEDLQGAAVVADVHIGHVADDGVGDETRDFPEDHAVFSSCASSCHNIKVMLKEVLHHHGDVAGVVLQVSVHGCNEFTRGLVNAGSHGCCLTVVFVEDHQFEI